MPDNESELDKEYTKLVRAVVLRVTCIRHGDEGIEGAVGSFNLGYGKLMLDLNGRVQCRLCGGDDHDGWLHLNVEVETDMVVTKGDMIAVLQEDMAASTGEVDDSPAKSPAVPRQDTNSPTAPLLTDGFF